MANNKLSEFHWEKELRKDDERIFNYLVELNKFIDLPLEEEVIVENLQNQSKLVPQIINLSNNEQDFDTLEKQSNSSKRINSSQSLYHIIEKITYQWVNFIVFNVNDKDKILALTILSLYGKLLTKIADFSGLADTKELPTPLKIALAKRAISIINNIHGEMNEFSKMGYNKPLLESHKRRLQISREKIIDTIINFREMNNKDKI